MSDVKTRKSDTRVVIAKDERNERVTKPVCMYDIVDTRNGERLFGPAKWNECLEWRRENLA